jgi:hypothetical protein
MNKRSEIQQKVYEVIKKNDGANAEQIRKATTLSRIMVDNCLHFLLGEQSIFLWNDFGNCKIYKTTK